MKLVLQLGLVLLLVAVVSASAVALPPPSPDVITINTTSGLFVGSVANNVATFLGVPYARAPVGELRWQAPVPLRDPNVLKTATDAVPVCPQPALALRPDQAEDCLYLSIYAPASDDGLIKRGLGAPIMLYLHGGGFDVGSGADGLYRGDFMVNRTGVIVVTVQYRLGALGFLASGPLAGNYGFLDQQMALRWVQENAVTLGGDPKRVTLFGQSAGGISVATHLTAPSSFGLYSRAIVHSDPFVVRYLTVDQMKPVADHFAKLLQCTSGDVVCLRNRTVDEIMHAQSQIALVERPQAGNLQEIMSSVLVWAPVIDDKLILGSPLDLFHAGKTAGVPIVMGSTRNETAGWVLEPFPSVPVTPLEYTVLLRSLFAANANAVHSQYPAHSVAEVRPQLALLLTDFLMTCAIRNAAVAYAGTVAAPFVSKYLFLHPPSSDPVNNITVSQCSQIHEVCHGEELDFVFHSAAFSGATMTPAEENLSDLMLTYWTNFALSETRTSAFPRYSTASDNSLGFDLDGAKQILGYRSEKCDFWDSLGFYESNHE